MLVFVTSVMHPQSANSYRRIWELLNNTLVSVCSQTDRDFKVIVVCNKILLLSHDSELIHKNTCFVQVDFPCPGPETREKIMRLGKLNPPAGDAAWEEEGQFFEERVNDRLNIRTDKGSKLIVGLLAAREYSPEYVLFFDADDFLINDMASFVNTNPGRKGWIMSRGYRMLGDKTVPFYRKESFCGTGNTFSYDLLSCKIPALLSTHSSQVEIFSGVETEFMLMALGSHRHTRSYFRKASVDLEEFPFSGVVHLLGTGENHSDIRNFTKKFSRNRDWEPITNELIDDYNITLPKKSFWRSIGFG